MVDFINSLTTDQKIELIKAIITALSIFIGALISIIQISKVKKKEIEFKAHEQRKIKYEQLLKMIQMIFANTNQISKGKFPMDRNQWLEIQLGIMVYASQDVFKKYLQIVYCGQSEDEERGYKALLSLGELILAMRKEVGFNDDKLTIRECLSTIVTDINDKKYDEVFKR